jgi:putative membrane protein
MNPPNRRKSMLAPAVLALVLAGAAHAAPNDESDNRTLTEPATSAPAKSLSNGDRAFIAKAAEGDMAEVAEGKIAGQNGQSPTVKEFGGRMVHDHTSINDNLQRIAAGKGVRVPDKLDSSGEKGIDKLQGLSGTKFDKAYSKQQVSDHKKAIKAFEKEAKSGSDSDLKGFAEQTLPTLREHLKLAQAAESAAKSESKSQSKSQG